MSLNIVIFGAGIPGQFGYDFVQKVRGEGHNVTVFSHKEHVDKHPQNITIEYGDYQSCEKTFDQFLIDNNSEIDFLIFNQSGGVYPFFIRDGYEKPNLQQYQYTLNSQVVIPHLFISKTINKMKDGSKTIFFCNTSGLTLEDRFRMGTDVLVGYVGANAWKVNMMYGYAKARTKNITYCCMAPSIRYHTPEGVERYKNQDFNLLYNWVFSVDDTSNGKIMTCWGDPVIRKLVTGYESQ